MIKFVGRCFFCEKAVANMRGPLLTKEGIKKFIGKYGEAEKFGGQIGKKLICDSCVRSIADLIKYLE